MKKKITGIILISPLVYILIEMVARDTETTWLMAFGTFLFAAILFTAFIKGIFLLISTIDH